jgi:UTP--glucose-1-phosphate uridylyltransferase
MIFWSPLPEYRERGKHVNGFARGPKVTPLYRLPEFRDDSSMPLHLPIRKAVIPAAGLGTRMLPAAKAVPKELLPILDRPTIQYVVEEAANAGLSDVLLVTSPQKPALLNHFLPNEEISARLAKSGKSALLKSIDELIHRVKIGTVMQDQQLGLGDAVLRAREYVGDEPFICLLGDTIFSGDIGPASQLVRAYEKYGTSIIGLEEVPAEKVSRYGVVGGTMLEEGVIRIDKLVEKPSIENAPSRFAIAARYVLKPLVFQCLSQSTAGVGGEIQLTDSLQALCEREPMHGVILKSKRHDIGNPLDWLKTNIAYAANDPVMWKQIEPMLRSLMNVK